MKPQLRAVDPDRELNLDYARRKVNQWKSDTERGKLSISNQDDTGAPSLRVDDVLKRSLPNHAKENSK